MLINIDNERVFGASVFAARDVALRRIDQLKRAASANETDDVLVAEDCLIEALDLYAKEVARYVYYGIVNEQDRASAKFIDSLTQAKEES